jgi:hypothetical protein
MNLRELDSFKMSDAVVLHDTLNPALFDGDHLRPDVRAKLLEIAEEFIDYLGVSNLDVRDITISGSNAAYSYTPHSDIDLHIIANLEKFNNDAVYRELFTAKKNLFNADHNIKIKGYDVELYVQDSSVPVRSLGEYSVERNKWIKFPSKKRANLDHNAVENKFKKLVQLGQLALRTDSMDALDDVLSTLKRYRQAGLDEHGEFGPENLAYKALRSQGIVDKLYNHMDALKSRQLSLDEQLYADSDYKEIEFVCANPKFPEATDPKLQKQMYRGLQQISGVIPLLQDQSEYSEGQYSLTAIYKDPSVRFQILKLAKRLGVQVDLEQPVSDDYVDRAIRGEHYGQQIVAEASGYIPSEAEKDDPRFSTALTVDVHPDSIQQNAKKLGSKIKRSGVPPTLKPSGKI